MSRPGDPPDPARRAAVPPPRDAWGAAGQVLDLVSGKWVLGILEVLDRGPRRHNQLHRDLGRKKVSARSLDLTLRRMAAAGLITRHVDAQDTPPAVSYELTPVARSLIRRPLAVLGSWGAAHERQLRASRRQPGNPAA